MPLTHQKKALLMLLGAILVSGFLAMSLLSFFVSRTSLRTQIAAGSLPLISDNVYSEIQKDIIKPVYIASVMANNTFLRDWVLAGEKEPERIAAFLDQIKERYGTLTSFFVSENTQNYYYPEGILKQVREDEERDVWYFRVRNMESEYELNIDPDMANMDTMTIFINHRVYDYDGNYIGATGVGIAINAALDTVRRYRERFDSDVYFISRDGTIVLRSDDYEGVNRQLTDEPGLGSFAAALLEGQQNTFSFRDNHARVFANSRLIPELNWYLLVTQRENALVAPVFRTLLINLALCAIITAIVIFFTTKVINAHQQVVNHQHDELREGNRRLIEKNEELDAALRQVKRLSGLLPICAACKKVRDDRGYWQQIEMYIQDHSDASFTHGICPECRDRLYPDCDTEHHK